jgi:hypothetical protein
MVLAWYLLNIDILVANFDWQQMLGQREKTPIKSTGSSKKSQTS